MKFWRLRMLSLCFLYVFFFASALARFSFTLNFTILLIKSKGSLLPEMAQLKQAC